MRTTLDLADDVMAAARTLAAERAISIGDALSAIARRGLEPRDGVTEGLIATFAVATDAVPITPEMVHEANEDS